MRSVALPRPLSRIGSGDETARRIAVVAAIGILIRLAFMPFTLHFDAYQIYSRAAEAAYGNEWFGFTSQFLIQMFHNLWLLLIRPLLPHSAGIWSDTASTIGVGASREDYERFLAYDQLYRLIFLLKLPYVIADLVCAWVLTRLVAPAQRVAVAAFWLLNPLVIFSSAIYGRHDALAILLVLLALYVVRQRTGTLSDRRRLIALGLLGIATLTRFFPVIVLPLFLLAYRRSARQLGLFLGLLLGMAVLVELAGLATSGKSTTLTILNSYEHFQYWFDAGLYLRFDDWIFLFPVVYGIGLLWLSERGLTPAEFPVFGAVAFLLLFSLTFFHPHYAIWLVPFLALTIPPSPRMTVYHGIQIACILVYSMQWGAWTTWDLFEPLLGRRVASLPDPVEAISAQIEPRIFFGVFRSLLTAVSLWMVWRLLRGENTNHFRPNLGGEGFKPSRRQPVDTPSSVDHLLDVPSRSTHSTASGIDEREGLKPSRTRSSGRWLALVLLPMSLLTTACTAQVSGYENPIAHDYGPVGWRPLVEPVEQVFVAGPGYFAAVANDARTTPEQFQQRLAALPEDARSGDLQGLSVGLRLPDDLPVRWNTGARVELAYAPEHDLASRANSTPGVLAGYEVDDLPRDGDWVRIETPPDLESGRVVRLRLIPGQGPDAGRLAYGVTVERAPYGGWMATTAAGSIAGSLLVETTYERDVDLRGIVRQGIENVRDSVGSDAPFAALYLTALLALVATGMASWRSLPRRSA